MDNYSEKPRRRERATIVKAPDIVKIIGILICLISVVFAVVFLIVGNKSLKLPVVIAMAVFLILGIIITYASLKFRVIVRGDNIIVHPVKGQSYSCTFDDIKRTKHIKKKNGDDKLIVIFRNGERLKLDSTLNGYRNFKIKLTAYNKAVLERQRDN